MIKTVTITGADNGIDPGALFVLSEKYPFVEWGILVSRTRAGTNRFPPLRWIDNLVNLNTNNILNNKKSLNLSMHLCGAYVRELLSGDIEFIEEELDDIWMAFSRVQINTHASPHFINSTFYRHLTGCGDKEFIFQHDGINGGEIRRLIKGNGINYSFLFDVSHGAGILAREWPKLLPGVKCGYAGGLSPENLEEQICLIEKKAGNAPIWIDMETHVRSNHDKQFDLKKVEECLQIASKFIK